MIYEVKYLLTFFSPQNLQIEDLRTLLFTRNDNIKIYNEIDSSSDMDWVVCV